MALKFANGYRTSLAAAVAAGADSFQVKSAAGAPALASGDWCYVTIGWDGNNEVVKCTARSGTTWTGLVAGAWSADTPVTIGMPAEALADVIGSGGDYKDLAPLFLMPWDLGIVGYGVPDGVRNSVAAYADLSGGDGYTLDNSGYMTGGVLQLPVAIVSGGAGQSALAVTYNSAQFASAQTDCGATGDGAWLATLTHVDGSIGVYQVTAAGASTVTVQPPLRKPVAFSPLCNYFEGHFSQHLSRSGHAALADAIVRASPVRARLTGGYAHRWAESGTSAQNTADGAAGWVAYGGYNLAASSWAAAEHTFSGSTAGGSKASARNNVAASHNFTAAGHGVRKTISVSGPGRVSAFIGISNGVNPVWVRVIGDKGLGTERTIFKRHVFGLEHVVVPYSGHTTVTLEIEAVASGTGVRIGTTTLFNDAGADPFLFKPSSRGILFAHSWGDGRHGGAYADELSRHLAPIGVRLDSFSRANQTTAWALSNLSSLIARSPDWALIQFDVNDYNAVGGMDQATWIANLKTIATTLQAAGIKPIIVMTISESRDSGYGMLQWATALENSAAAATGWLA